MERSGERGGLVNGLVGPCYFFWGSLGDDLVFVLKFCVLTGILPRKGTTSACSFFGAPCDLTCFFPSGIDTTNHLMCIAWCFSSFPFRCLPAALRVPTGGGFGAVRC